jgi:phosphate transport system substrate-binding protein
MTGQPGLEHRLVALRSRVLAAVAAALPLALAAGCSGGTVPEAQAAAASPGGGIPAGPAPGPQALSETGSTLLWPVLRLWAAAYHQQHTNVSITTAGTGSGKGIAEASAGTVDIGASDAYLSSGDLVTNPAMVNIPLAVSAQQVNYNLAGLRPAGTHLKLNGKILAEMYQGAITSWNDPRIAAINPGVTLPHLRVVPLHRAESAGDTFLFTSYLSTQDAAWDRVTGYGTTVNWPHVTGARAETGNTGMVSGCEAVAGCVAYVGIAYLSSATAGGLGYAALRNALGDYEAPTPKSIGTAVGSFVSTTPVNETISMVDGPAVTGYPIVNYEYAIVSTRQHSPAKARDIKAFLHWAITAGNAARYLGQARFQPLPASIVSLSDAQIAKIG